VALDLVRESEPRRLAESLWLGRSTVVNAITRLEKRGFVEREPAANDHRLVIVRITDAGREIMELGARSQAETVNSLDWEMSDAEIDTLAALSRKVWRLNYRLVAKSIESSPRVGDATS
jgi:DNA-binding MarR family transcriptional regulator